MKTQEIISHMSAAIVSGKLPPGAKLNERDLAAIFDVSRTVVRQALIRLQEDGLVSISPQRATTVVQPTTEDAHQLFEALSLLEIAAVERIAGRISERDVARMRGHVAKEIKAYESGQKSKANQLGRDFHSLFVGFLRNDVVGKMHHQLLRQEALITALYKTDFDYGCLRHDHAAIIDCLESGDIARAKEILTSHYNLVIHGYQFEEGSQDIDVATALS